MSFLKKKKNLHVLKILYSANIFTNSINKNKSTKQIHKIVRCFSSTKKKLTLLK